VRALACVGWLALCLSLVGCSLFGKKSGGGPNGSSRAPDAPAPAPASPFAANPAPVQPMATTSVGGILAGQVLDSYNRRPPATFIQVVSSQEPRGGAPIEVAADSMGYFTIQGLKPGQGYELIARAKDGDRILAGRVWVTPPDPKVLIRVSEDLATGTTPPVPPPPASNPPTAPQSSTNRDPSWAPGRTPSPNSIGPRRAAELGTPGTTEEPAATAPAVQVRPQDIAQAPNPRPDPRISIPSPGSRNPSDGAVIGSPVPEVPTRVPSCALIGGHLHNFALNDLNGQPWEYRKDRRGRLLLLDFWGHTCGPCIEGMAHLNSLQGEYGRNGLEVIGIAYNISGMRMPSRDFVRKIEGIVSYKQVHYRILVGDSFEGCPVRTQFNVHLFPTLVLIDETGRIVWRAEDGNHMPELEQQIQSRLGRRMR
jgi:thiol-disulfide isomerase/thioredoxin